MKKRKKLYAGKAKSIYATDNDDLLVLHFRDDTSAFNGKIIKQLDRKGMINNQLNAFIMQKLSDDGIPPHFEKVLSTNECLVKKIDMIPIECVIRNIAAGSLCTRLGIEEGVPLEPPTFESFLKNDSLADPLLNDYHIESFNWATKEQLDTMKKLTFQINNVLKSLFLTANILLIDSKLEFGIYHDEVILGDEFSPDSCRLWDKDSHEILDKDRFRQNLGHVVESYELVGQRLGLSFD